MQKGQSIINYSTLPEKDECASRTAQTYDDGKLKNVEQSDDLIQSKASWQMTALGHKQDQKQDDVYRMCNSARTLGHIVLYAVSE